MANISLRDYFAAHTPMAPNWFTSTLPKTNMEMIPDPERGKGYVNSNTVVIVETPLQREVRWRFSYAEAMVLGSAPAA